MLNEERRNAWLQTIAGTQTALADASKEIDPAPQSGNTESGSSFEHFIMDQHFPPCLWRVAVEVVEVSCERGGSSIRYV